MKKKFLIAFLTSILGFTVLYSTVLSSIFFDKPVEASKETLPGEEEELVEDNNDSILFLLMGVDAEDMSVYRGIRTDTMMLTNIDLKTGEVNILSLPRDLRVPVRGKMDKLNHAHSYDGPELTVRTVRDFLNIDLEYYVRIDYRAVKEIVDAIDGVEIDVHRRMYYSRPNQNPPLYIDLQPGLQTLNGEESLQFLRWRQNQDGSGYAEGDIGRVQAQQRFVEELIKQSLQAKNIIKLPTFISAYWDYVDTNLSLGQMAKAALAANKIDLNKIETATVPGKGEYIGPVSYYLHDSEETDLLVEDFFGNYILD